MGFTHGFARLLFRGIGLLFLSLAVTAPAAHAFELTDSQVKDEMARRASLFCPGYTTERGMPGLDAVPAGALRVMLDHKYLVCPDRRVGDSVGAIWNSRDGVLLWNPDKPKSVAVMAARASAMTHSLDFPDELMVYDLDGKPLKGQVVPSFEPRDSFSGFGQ